MEGCPPVPNGYVRAGSHSATVCRCIYWTGKIFSRTHLTNWQTGVGKFAVNLALCLAKPLYSFIITTSKDFTVPDRLLYFKFSFVCYNIFYESYCLQRGEITNISEHGFWILLDKKEYFLPFTKYPWFKDARISSLINVELIHGHHFHWPELDVDLSIEILDNPEKYPLSYT